MAASRVKSVSFKEDEKNLLEHCENKGNFSEYVKKLIKGDMLKGNKLLSMVLFMFPYSIYEEANYTK